MSFTQHLAACGARYDNLALRPPTAPPRTVAAAHWQALQAWCHDGAGPGGAPLLQPGALPRVQRRFALAHWRGDDAVAEAWALALDGSARLAALPGHADQLLLRLRTKLNDVAWWRQR
ncbi:hypothetical protein, partial [Aquabacterium sp.]|uniref:hypothetical protein n=1 Tax=Aquabacterium sp. TaxID=1872578 RepID=UPI002C3FCEE5